jgi:hypothetical protein
LTVANATGSHLGKVTPVAIAAGSTTGANPNQLVIRFG